MTSLEDRLRAALADRAAKVQQDSLRPLLPPQASPATAFARQHRARCRPLIAAAACVIAAAGTYAGVSVSAPQVPGTAMATMQAAVLPPCLCLGHRSPVPRRRTAGPAAPKPPAYFVEKASADLYALLGR